MAKNECMDEEDRKLLLETQQKLDAATKLMNELMETVEILNDSNMMKAIQEGKADIKAGRVKELRKILADEAR
jgi:PHD/YefM family antitoxin component YafN of YafNO toxin-antitoxin module